MRQTSQPSPRAAVAPARRVLCLLTALVVIASGAMASSHREAPLISELPKVDGTDFYMFRSYEPGREGFVTLIANYLPLQDPYGGPNFFDLDPDARYRFNIENDGEPGADLIFELRFWPRSTNIIEIPVGGVVLSIPLLAAGPVGNAGATQLFTIDVIRDGDRDRVVNGRNGGFFFAKAMDHFGDKTFVDYEEYAERKIIPIEIPGCAGEGQVFVGQRKESFAVNLGEIFDLVNLNPVGDPQIAGSTLEDKSVTALALEVPVDCLTGGNGPVIGGWTTAHLPRNRVLSDAPTFMEPTNESGELVQVSRLGMPLVNEVVIGLADKNLFNASSPADDVQFASYVTNPTLPELLEILFGVQAPNNFPRQDLIAAFVTGVDGLNALGFGEMQRLNVGIAPTAKAAQHNLGVIGGDNAGFPNGRRPGDDVVDIELRVAMGLLCHAFPGVYCVPSDAPSGTLPYTDGAWQGPAQFDNAFPYLKPPSSPSPNPFRVFVADLDGDQEVPPVDTASNGGCSALIATDESSVLVQCAFDADAVMAHIHNAAAGTNGAVVCDFTAVIDNGSLTHACTADNLIGLTLPQFLQQLRQGNLYVNVHTADNPGGEIRGQLN